MNILITNVHSFHNAGDAVLNKIAIYLLRQNFTDAHIIMALNDLENFDEPASSGVRSFLSWSKNDRGKWRWFTICFLLITSIVAVIQYRLVKRPLLGRFFLPWSPLLEAYVKVDLVVSCPGNFLYGSGRLGLNLIINLYSILFAWLLGKPLYMLPQTVGPFHHAWERRAVGWVLSKMRLVMVRDEISQQVLREMGLDQARCLLLPDIAFAYPPVAPALGEKLLRAHEVDIKSGDPLLGITLINWGAQNHRFSRQAAYEQAVAQAVRTFLKRHGGTAVLFSQVQGPTAADDDRIPARRVAGQLADLGQHVVFIERSVTQDELKSAYAFMDLFLGSRLHSNIFALSSQVPVVAVQYQYKTTGIMRMLNLEEWVIAIENTTADSITELLAKAWTRRAELKATIQIRLPPIIKQIESAGQLIANDYYRKDP